MKFGFRTPSLKKRIAARTSWKRVVRHNLGMKAPRGWGWLTNPKKAAYNRVYNRTTFGLDTVGRAPRSGSSTDATGCGCLLALGAAAVGLASLGAAAWPVFLGVCGLVIVVSIMNGRRKARLAAAAAQAQQSADQHRWNSLNERFGSDVAGRIWRHEVWQGATIDMIVESLGQPADIDERVFKTKTKRVYKYSQIASNRYALKVTFENGIVVGWDDKR